MTKETQAIAIIGAGISGMSAAYDLAKAGKKVVIYEADDHVGGLAAGFKEPNWDWSVEYFYHHWFGTDRHMLGLIDELGWSDDVLFPQPQTVLYHKGKFYPFDSIKAAILYPGLGWGINKIRFGLVGIYLRLTNNWRKLEKVTAEAWMRKWAGNKVYEEMWQPLMVGKFGEEYASKVNMAWLWARMHTRTTRLGTFKGGFQAFCERFADKLRQMGVEIHLQMPIKAIRQNDEEQLILESQRGKEPYAQVLVTLSPAALARLTPELNENYLKHLRELKNTGAVVLTVALKQPLSPEGYYWYNIPKSAGFPFLSLVEHTNFLPKEHFGGESIIYIGDYLPAEHEYFTLTKEQLLERFMPHLTKINPNFKPDWVRQTWIYRAAYAQPIPFVNHSHNIPPVKTPLQGLYFASMSQVYPWDRGTNFAVELARSTARMMLEDQM